jgi:hypothetical protein
MEEVGGWETDRRASLGLNAGLGRGRWSSAREVGLCNHNLEESWPVVGLVSTMGDIGGGMKVPLDLS